MTTRWDDIVIGSGPAGACVARTLAEAGRRVLVVERGRVVSDPPGSHLRNRPDHRDNPDGWFAAVDAFLDLIDPDVPLAGLPGAASTSIVGGSGILWTNNCPRAVDGVDRPDLLDDDAWATAYQDAERLLGVRQDEFGDSRRAEAIRTALAADLELQGRELGPLPLAGRRLTNERRTSRPASGEARRTHWGVRQVSRVGGAAGRPAAASLIRLKLPVSAEPRRGSRR